MNRYYIFEEDKRIVEVDYINGYYSAMLYDLDGYSKCGVVDISAFDEIKEAILFYGYVTFSAIELPGMELRFCVR